MLLVGSGPSSDTGCQEFFRVLDMTTLEWTDAFDPAAEPYGVPPAISAVIGGNATGGATNLAPSQDTEGSWSSSLEDLFATTPWGPANFTSKNIKNSTATQNPSGRPINPTAAPFTPPPAAAHSSKLQPGVIAGISIASFVAVIITLTIVWYFCFRRRRALDTNHYVFGDGKPELHGQTTQNGVVRRELDGRSIVEAP
jgi:hypothetical protein